MAQRLAPSSSAGGRVVNYHVTPSVPMTYIPIAPQLTPVYENPRTAQRYPLRRMSTHNSSWLIKSTVNDWTRFVHPDGSRYWGCFIGDVRIVSDVEPPLFTQKPAVVELLQHAASEISGFSDADDWEIHFTGECCTYIHRTARAASSENQTYAQFKAQVQSGRHMTSYSFRAETMYWAFVESHPNHRGISEEDFQDANEALTWCYADRLLHDSSNAPFEKENAREMLEAIERISKLKEAPSVYRSTSTLETWYCAAVLRVVAYDRRYSRYGQRNVTEVRGRAQSDDADIIIPCKSFVGWMAWHLASFVAFGSPFGYFKRIVNVDRTSINEGINVIRWRSFIKEICQEWADSNLLATVLVSATVSLLAIPGLNGLAQIAGLLSAFCALGSVLSGMLLISNHQAQAESSGAVAAAYFTKSKAHGMGSTRPLAVVLSLPISLMLWGMFWFIFAIASCAYATGLPGISPKYVLSTRVVPLAFLLMFLAMGLGVVLFLYKIWGTSNNVTRNNQDEPKQATPVKAEPSVHTHQDGQLQSTNDTKSSSPHQSELVHGPAPPDILRRPTVEFDDNAHIIPNTPVLSRISEGSFGRDEYPRHFTSENSRSPATSYIPVAPRINPGVVPLPEASMSSLEPSSHGMVNPAGVQLPSSTHQRGYRVVSTIPAGYHIASIVPAPNGPRVLVLTPTNQEGWLSHVRDDIRYRDLVSSIREIASQYGTILSLSARRQLYYGVAQAFIQFQTPEQASAALQGLQDHNLVDYIVSSRLLTSEEEIIWRMGTTLLPAIAMPLASELPVHEEPPPQPTPSGYEPTTQIDEITAAISLKSSSEASMHTANSEYKDSPLLPAAVLSKQELMPPDQSPDSLPLAADSTQAGHHVVDISPQ